MISDDMSRAQFTVVYDGPALADHTMDVRDLAPALLAIGELYDAANRVLNGDSAQVTIHVKAHAPGCFSVDLDLIQTVIQRGIKLLSGTEFTAASNLTQLVGGGIGIGTCLIWLIKKLKGKSPDKLTKIDDGTIRITIGQESIDVPLKLLRLYQDIAVRDAADRVIKEPLEKEGVDKIEFKVGPSVTSSASKAEAEYFSAPEVPEDTLLEDRRRAAYSIVSLSFKEDNKWRLSDGSNPISVLIKDQDFLAKVDRNAISFAKGDVLICDVSISQKQSKSGLRTEHVVGRVIEHKPAPRQLAFKIDEN